jgi:hypothetical protein
MMEWIIRQSRPYVARRMRHHYARRVLLTSGGRRKLEPTHIITEQNSEELDGGRSAAAEKM